MTPERAGSGRLAGRAAWVGGANAPPGERAVAMTMAQRALEPRRHTRRAVPRRRLPRAGNTWDGRILLAELDAALATVAGYTDFPGGWGGLTSRRTAAGSGTGQPGRRSSLGGAGSAGGRPRRAPASVAAGVRGGRRWRRNGS